MMDDYYLDELMLVLDEYANMHRVDKNNTADAVYANDF